MSYYLKDYNGKERPNEHDVLSAKDENVLAKIAGVGILILVGFGTFIVGLVY